MLAAQNEITMSANFPAATKTPANTFFILSCLKLWLNALQFDNNQKSQITENNGKHFLHAPETNLLVYVPDTVYKTMRVLTQWATLTFDLAFC